MASLKRRQLLVDPKVQGALLTRAVLYWGYCLLGAWSFVCLWKMVTSPASGFDVQFDESLFYCGPMVVATVAILPLVLVDLLRVTNRFVGPLFRLRRDMRKLVNGEPVRQIAFRKNDYWRETAEEFNALADHVQRLERELAAAQQQLSARRDAAEACRDSHELLEV